MKSALAVSLIALTALGCGAAADRVLLEQFFAASRLRDLTALRKVATVVFEPATDGIITTFAITGVVDRGSGAKDVTIAAPVRMFDGRTVTKRYAVTVDAGRVTAFTEQPALSPVEGPASRPTEAAAAASTPPR